MIRDFCESGQWLFVCEAVSNLKVVGVTQRVEIGQLEAERFGEVSKKRRLRCLFKDEIARAALIEQIENGDQSTTVGFDAPNLAFEECRLFLVAVEERE